MGYIYWLFLRYQIIKKRERIEKILAQEIVKKIDWQVVAQMVSSNKNLSESLQEFLSQGIESFLRNKLPEEIPMLKMFITDKIIGQFKRPLLEQLCILIPQAITKMITDIPYMFPVSDLIQKNISLMHMHNFLAPTIRDAIKLFQWWMALAGLILGTIAIYWLA